MAETVDLTRRRVEATSRSAEEIREDISATRESISDTVEKLGTKLQSKLDWREYVADYPVAALGLAAGAGIFISRLLPRRAPTPGERIIDAIAETVEDVTDDLRGSIGQVAALAGIKRDRSRLGGAARMAVGGAITQAAAAFLRKTLFELADRKSGERFAETRAPQRVHNIR